MSNKVIMGYGENWYPKTEPVIPRVYHEYLKDSDKANIYTAKDLDIEFAYFACNPENYDVFNGAGTNVKLNLEKINKVKLVPRVGGTNNTTDVVKTAPSITNLDEDPTYVRLHIAIPACLDDALPTFNASYNMLHFNSKKDEALITFPWRGPSAFCLKKIQFSLVTQSCPTLCDPIDCSTPGLSVPHHLPEFAHVHVHCMSDAIQPSHPLRPSFPSALNLSQHQGLFQ